MWKNISRFVQAIDVVAREELDSTTAELQKVSKIRKYTYHTVPAFMMWCRGNHSIHRIVMGIECQIDIFTRIVVVYPTLIAKQNS